MQPCVFWFFYIGINYIWDAETNVKNLQRLTNVFKVLKMICRLCLEKLHKNRSLAIFHDDAHDLARIIAIHLQIRISEDDEISTNVCLTCYQELEDFNKFWEYIEQKQIVIRSRFKGVEACDNDISGEFEGENCGNDFYSGETGDPLECDQREDEDTMSVSTLKDEYESDDFDQEEELLPPAEELQEILEVNIRSSPTSKTPPLSLSGMEVICTMCQKEVRDYDELRTHFQRSHKNDPCIICCGIEYTVYDKLAHHIEWHKYEEELTCHICYKIFRSLNSLKEHYNWHKKNPGEIAYHCKKCPLLFSVVEDLRAHIATHNTNTDKQLRCYICAKGFESFKHWSRHVRLTHERRPYGIHTTCNVCGKRFKTQEFYDEHMILHEGTALPKVQCDICLTWVKNRHVLSRHKMSHVKLDLQCKTCHKRFSNEPALESHNFMFHKPKHTRKKHPCQICGRVFNHKVILEEHMAVHNGIFLYKCPYCNKETRSRSNMYVHIKRSHLEEWLQRQTGLPRKPILKIATNTKEEDVENSIT